MIQLTLVSGRCRWCGCTEDQPSAQDRRWANADATLCIACVSLERAMRTPNGRRRLAEFLHARQFVVHECFREDL